jgi:Ni,Fe-hydrogenase III large subunit
MSDRSPALARPHHTSRPSVTKEDIQKVENDIVEAEKIIEVAVETHKTKSLQRELDALKKIQGSKEYKAKVEAFRGELASRFET